MTSSEIAARDRCTIKLADLYDLMVIDHYEPESSAANMCDSYIWDRDRLHLTWAQLETRINRSLAAWNTNAESEAEADDGAQYEYAVALDDAVPF